MADQTDERLDDPTKEQRAAIMEVLGRADANISNEDLGEVLAFVLYLREQRVRSDERQEVVRIVEDVAKEGGAECGWTCREIIRRLKERV